MKQIPLFLAALTFLLSAQPSARSVKLSDIFTRPENEYAKNGRFITYARIKGKGEATNYQPSVPFIGNISLFSVNPADFDVVGIEKCFIKAGAEWGDNAFNALIDPGRLKGMKYYSRSESGVRTLITESLAVSEPSWIRDRDNQRVITHFTITDNRLGSIPFNNDIIRGGYVIFSSAVSSGTVKRFGLKIFNPGDYRIYRCIVYDRAASGWFYFTIQFMRVRSDIMKTIDLLLPENICNRLRADTVHFLGLAGINRSGELAAFR